MIPLIFHDTFTRKAFAHDGSPIDAPHLIASIYECPMIVDLQFQMGPKGFSGGSLSERFTTHCLFNRRRPSWVLCVRASAISGQYRLCINCVQCLVERAKSTHFSKIILHFKLVLSILIIACWVLASILV